MGKFIDLTGQRFGRLTVMKQVDRNKWKNICWLCRCDCGEEKIIRGSSFKSSKTKSCGCLHREKMTQHGHNKKHQESQIHITWRTMIQRCTNPNSKDYRNYGGRGIKMCERWMKFINFLADMGEPQTNKHSIDRINNDKNYCKSNCRWALPREQARNRRNNRLITYDNKTQCMYDWAKELGINYITLWGRFNNGWSVKKALMASVRTYEKG